MTQFGMSHDPLFQRTVARSLVNIGYVCDDPEAALLACDDALGRLRGVAEPDLLEQVAKALINKGSILRRIGRDTDALASFDDLLIQFRGTPHAPLREFLAAAFLGKGAMLHKLGRNSRGDINLRRHVEVVSGCDRSGATCARLQGSGKQVNSAIRSW